MADVKPMFTLERLALLLQNNHIKDVLDIWGGKGQQSLLCASYHCEVDVVDPDTRDEFKYTPSLIWHPHIKRYVMKAEDFKIEKKYDLIIFLHVVMFMDKKFVLEEYLPWLQKHLKSKWMLYISYILPDDLLVAKITNQAFYSPDEICWSLLWLQLIESYSLTKDILHPKHGTLTLPSQFMIFKKK